MNDELDEVLASYRDMFGKLEHGNDTHRTACIAVARLRRIEKAAEELAGWLRETRQYAEMMVGIASAARGVPEGIDAALAEYEAAKK